MNIKQHAKKYFSLDDKEKSAFLRETYINQEMSWIAISKLVGTYPNKVRRDARSLGLLSRDKIDAQKKALEHGRAKHPTEGKERKQETKIKISETQGQVWDNMSDFERNQRSKIGKDSWDKKTEGEKNALIKKGGDAIRTAAKFGSKLERFLLEELTKRKYRVQFHKEHWLKNKALETDLYIEDLRTVIEVDGPSHFEPVWGETNLVRNQRSDAEKTGLVLGEGLVLIRIKQTQRISQRYLRNTLNNLIGVLEDIKKSFPKETKRYIEI